MGKIICLSGNMLILHGIGDTIFYEEIPDEFEDEIPSANEIDTIKNIVFHPVILSNKISEGVVYDVKYETKTHLFIISNRGGSVIPKCMYNYDEVFINENLDYIDEL